MTPRAAVGIGLLGILTAVGTPAPGAQVMTRTLKAQPAVVLAAFGTSTRAQVTYDRLDRRVREAFPAHEIRWAFTSEVIREKVNARRAVRGEPDRLRSLQQALADLEAEGFTRAVVQPVHVFPGEEYEEVVRIARGFPGIRTWVGEALLQRWETVHRVVERLAQGFLPPDEGCNVLVAHGTPQTHIGSNIAYLGLDRLLRRRYPNAFLGAVEGVVTREDALGSARAWPARRVRFIPLMFVAGDHIMNDIMGEGGDPGEPSWRGEMAAAGFRVDAPTVEVDGETHYRGLGFLPEVLDVFVESIRRGLDRI